MRIGLIARADNTGLGMQTWEFYRHMEPAKTMVVDISRLNGNKQYPERYPDGQFVYGIPTAGDIDQFLADLDVVFVAEAPYNYYLYERARELGVKTAVQYNYEFFDWFVHPDWPKPDMLIAPSRWHYLEVDRWAKENGIQHTYLHCPVNRSAVPFRKITALKTFLHLAGRSAAHDRNGTKTVIEASKHLKSDAKIIIHFQGEQGLAHQATTSIDEYRDLVSQAGGQVDLVQHEFEDYADQYKQGDVLLLPRRYGGNCLPLNEALSAGMPVIMTDISPNYSLLPNTWLIDSRKIGEFTPRTKIDIYEADPIKLASRIDLWANMPSEWVEEQNQRANWLARSISWKVMAHQYQEALESLCAA